MKRKRRVYVAGDGTVYPLEEAETDLPITVYRKDCRKAIVGDAQQCIIAMGAKHDPRIEAAYIGSGKDAYVCFKATDLRKAHAKHYTIPANSARVRDYFDTHKDTTKQTLVLRAPTAGRTLAHRSKLNKARHARIKAGTHVPKKRDKGNKTRIMRLGVKHRPRAQIADNVVTMPSAA